MFISIFYSVLLSTMLASAPDTTSVEHLSSHKYILYHAIHPESSSFWVRSPRTVLYPTFDHMNEGTFNLPGEILAKLQELSPERYDFQYEVSVSSDTVYLSSSERLSSLTRDEIVLSLTMNGFREVRIVDCSYTPIYYGLSDVYTPYFDLYTQQVRRASISAPTRSSSSKPWLYIGLVAVTLCGAILYRPFMLLQA